MIFYCYLVILLFLLLFLLLIFYYLLSYYSYYCHLTFIPIYIHIYIHIYIYIYIHVHSLIHYFIIRYNCGTFTWKFRNLECDDIWITSLCFSHWIGIMETKSKFTIWFNPILHFDSLQWVIYFCFHLQLFFCSKLFFAQFKTFFCSKLFFFKTFFLSWFFELIFFVECVLLQSWTNHSIMWGHFVPSRRILGFN